MADSKVADSEVDLESQKNDRNDASPVSPADFSKAVVTREGDSLHVVFPVRWTLKWRIVMCISAVLLAISFAIQVTVVAMRGLLPMDLILAFLLLLSSFLIMISVFASKTEEELHIDHSSVHFKTRQHIFGVPRRWIEILGSTEDLKVVVAKNYCCCCVPSMRNVGIILHIARRPDQDANKSSCFGGPMKLVIAAQKLSAAEIVRVADEINDYLLQLPASEGQLLPGGARS